MGKEILKIKKALFLLGMATSTVSLTSCSSQKEQSAYEKADEYDYKITVPEDSKDSFLEKLEQDSNILYYDVLDEYTWYQQDNPTVGKVYVYGLKYKVNSYEKDSDEVDSKEKMRYKRITKLR